ncbi:DUF2752 domain-containing protein [Calidifontibacter terrae]
MTTIERPTHHDEVRDPRPLSRRVGPSLLLGGIVATSTLALHLHDPHQSGSWGKCPSLLLFGVYCPLCGGLRGVNDLTNFHFSAAASSNALSLVLLPVLVLWWCSVMRDRIRGSQRAWLSYAPGHRLDIAILVVVLVFTVVRNLPFGAALAP